MVSRRERKSLSGPTKSLASANPTPELIFEIGRAGRSALGRLRVARGGNFCEGRPSKAYSDPELCLTPCRPTAPRSICSGGRSSGCGGAPCAAAASATRPHGARSIDSPTAGSPNRASFIPGLGNASPSNTRGGSRMRECRPSGSVRGARSNARPSQIIHRLFHLTQIIPSFRRGRGQGRRPVPRASEAWPA